MVFKNFLSNSNFVKKLLKVTAVTFYFSNGRVCRDHLVQKKIHDNKNQDDYLLLSQELKRILGINPGILQAEVLIAKESLIFQNCKKKFNTTSNHMGSISKIQDNFLESRNPSCCFFIIFNGTFSLTYQRSKCSSFKRLKSKTSAV